MISILALHCIAWSIRKTMSMSIETDVSEATLGVGGFDR